MKRSLENCPFLVPSANPRACRINAPRPTPEDGCILFALLTCSFPRTCSAPAFALHRFCPCPVPLALAPAPALLPSVCSRSSPLLSHPCSSPARAPDSPFSRSAPVSPRAGPCLASAPAPHQLLSCSCLAWPESVLDPCQGTADAASDDTVHGSPFARFLKVCLPQLSGLRLLLS